MPVTPRQARRRSQVRNDAVSSEDSAPPSKLKPNGLYDSNTVQDRIRQWQVHGAANAPDPDTVSLRSTPHSDYANECERAQSPAGPPPTVTPRRPRRDEENGDQRREESGRSSPRKRVISDEHWKTRRAAKTDKSQQAAPREQVSTPHYDLSYTSTQRREEREARRERRRQARLSRGNEDIDSGKVDDIRPTASIAQDLDSYIDEELARRLGTPSLRGSVEDDDKTPHTRSKYAESLGQPDGHTVDAGLVKGKSKGAAVFFKTKEIFGRYEKPVSHRLPSIEAWLEEQPDPFVEVAEPSADTEVPTVEVPEPLKKRSQRTKRRSSTRTPTDPNKIWDSVAVSEVDRGDSQTKQRPQRRSDISLSHGDGASAKEEGHVANPAQPDESPSSLRRRAARVRRSKRDVSSTKLDGHESQELHSSPSKQSQQWSERQCPPPGAHPLATIAPVEIQQGQIWPADVLPQLEGPGLKRKLTTHEDLMSVLSLPMNRRSTRSRRYTKPQASQSAPDVLSTLVAEEERYSKELRTLVDGVIPVLLQCVLSKSDSIAAAGLFTSSANGSDDLAFTKPIIDMGVALERLKSLHNRIPVQNIDSLLGWAYNAQKAYNDYLRAWRLGFQDVVVNLAPLEDAQGLVDQGMSRDADGDIVNAEGKKADVAYLLKRPLVRVKNLTKTFEAIKQHSDRPLAKEVAQIYADLTALARRRHQEEQARLEDEAAARIDATRARDIRTLGATNKVSINQTRRVRARDCFNMTIYHTTGQRMDCRVELTIRDNEPGSPSGGDVLICEVEESGKWLLFAPVELHSISARRGEDRCDIVIMIRGPSGIGQEWQELLAMRADESDAVAEWMSMLGSNPLPPKLNRTQSFRDPEKVVPVVSKRELPEDGKHDRPPSIGEVDVPLGEPSVLGASERPTSKGRSNNPFERFMPRLNLGGGLQSNPQRAWAKQAKQDKPVQRKPVPSTISSDVSTISDKSTRELPNLPKAVSAPSTPTRPKSLHRIQTSAKDDGLYMMSGALGEDDVNSPKSNIPEVPSPSDIRDTAKQGSKAPSPPTNIIGIQSVPTTPALAPDTRPEYKRTISAAPSIELPTISKKRSSSEQEPDVASTPLNETIRDQWNALSGSGHSRRRSGQKASHSQIYTEDIPSPPAQAPSRAPPVASAMLRPLQSVPTPPPHRELSSSGPIQAATPTPEPQFGPTAKQEAAQKRKSSSPLKHEYAPSTVSDSTSNSESDSDSDSSSETSEDFMSETQDIAMPLVAVTAGNRRSSKFMQQHPQPPPSTSGTRTLAPSDSASQGPYRKVPASSTVPGSQKSKTIALICSWSGKGMWEQIHPDECSIVISPGLIEAFEMSAAHSGAHELANGQDSEDADRRSPSLTQQPLVAFELTPIVPLRRGTALDINIRSPPTANSKIRTTNNIMFRSRNPGECDTLYSMINWARCNNPTYIQLQRARPRQPSVTFNVGQPQQRVKSGSWFSFGGSQKQSSYRASSASGTGPQSVGGDSDASVGTINSAFSALKRLGVSSAFNVNRSSVTRKSGLSQASGSLYSSDSGGRTGSSSSTPAPSQLGLVPGKDGPNVPETSAEAANGGGMVTNMKIRLYVRKGQGWENLGAGRLTVMPAEDSTPKACNSGSSTPTGTGTPVRQASGGAVGVPNPRGPRLPSSSHTPHRVHGDGREKRILVSKNKDSGLVLLDATLGESCFERVMQTGIAVKVWTEDEEIAAKGGVILGRERIYMMQFPGTREAGWVFALCGAYRYGAE